MSAGSPDADNTTSYAYANTAYLLTSATSLLLTTLYSSPSSNAALILQMVLSILLLAFGAFNIPQFFPYTWLHWALILFFHTVVFIRGYTGWVGGGDATLGSMWEVWGSGLLWVWGVGLLVFAGEGRRARSTYLFTPSERRRQKVEKREQKFGKLERKMG